MFALALAWNAPAAIVSAVAFNSFQFFESDGETPLADGSWVMIIGTMDDTIKDPDMHQYGTTPEGDPIYLADSVMPGDTLVTMTRVFTCDIFGGGYIEAPFAIDTTVMEYLYLRIFDYQEDSISGYWGLTHWNHSEIYHISEISPFGEFDFAPEEPVSTTRQDHLMTIPEPGVMLFSLWGFLLLALSRTIHDQRKTPSPSTSAPAPLPRHPCEHIIREILQTDPWLTEN